MNKRFFYTLGLCTAVLGSAVVSSCAADDPESAVTPTNTGETVKTTFAISVPTGTTGTRQTSVNTQAEGNFRGISNIRLIPYVTDKASLFKPIQLANFGAFTNPYATEKGGYKLYSNVDIPVTTQNFLFYAEATPVTGDADNGALTPTYTEDTGDSYANINFQLKTIPSVGLAANKTDMENYLTELANVKVTGTDDTEIYWKNYNGSNDLAELYRNFISQTAGSKVAIYGVLAKLNAAVEMLSPSASGTDTQRLAQAIKTQIAGKPDLGNFPERYGLPQGCLTIAWNSSTSKFAYGTNLTLAQGTNPAIDFATICYPSALYYTVDTSLKASNASDINSWPGTLAAWNASYFNGWDDVVSASTHTIALVEPIQYAVAQLRTTVKCADVSSLKDNRSGIITGMDDQDIDIPATGFPVKGILIGGQPAQVGYDFKSSGSNFTQTVYDLAETGTVAKRNVESNIIYTLLLDNNATTQQSVTIAIELENNAADFYGVDGLVAQGSRFYLLGKLEIPAEPSVDHIFLQDYYTTANLTITSLQKAYVTIPDLTASQLQLALAVDLNWQEGLNFDISVGE